MTKKKTSLTQKERTALEYIKANNTVEKGMLKHIPKFLMEKLVESIKKGKGEFKITILGKEALKEEKKLIIKHKEIKSKSPNTSLVKTEPKTSKKEKGLLPEKYIVWSTPSFVEENNRWEFYKKDNEDLILEIYHSESEEEIIEQHKEKVMSHIMAAMKPEKEEGRERHPVTYNLSKEVKDNLNSGPRKQIKDTSIYLHNSAKFRILEMKLQGDSYSQIIKTVMTEFDLKMITVGLYVSDVMDDIKRMSRDIMVETLQSHIERYEEIFKWFRDNGYDRMALKVMERKEKLMGLHGEAKFEGTVFSSLNSGGDGKRYDWDLVSDKEKKRMMDLIKKTIIIIPKKGNNE
jgi:hypothetical protein